MVRFTVVALLLAVAAPAAAQVIPDEPAGDPGAGGETELDDDPPPATTDGDTGAEENPDAPRILGEPTDTGPKAPAPRATGYPIEEVLRPLTLPDFTSEIRLDAAIYPSPFDAEFGLRARYGITRQAQLGVRYAIGGLYDDGKVTPAKTRWNTGKAVEINFQFLVTDWVAPRIAIPMYVDPFTIGMTLGAPVKFRFGKKFAIIGFEDVVGFKFLKKKFLPTLEGERPNEADAATLDIGEIKSDGFIRLDFGAVYQYKPNVALTGRFGINFDDFSQRGDTGSSLRVQVQYSPKRKIDLLGLMGFDRLDEPGDTFHLAGALAVRI
ncbi:MAG: hypothetical protein IPH44_09310 [Myxococcales bacterium]|nr:hypothetical protein [Myxococcales bacterium]MBK7198745.1 hypothetical protein [Myxococcales bacterium]MBP6846740.1 hypothetical protein [Kofleriaceae bacterium]